MAKENLGHIMVDIETMGDIPGSAIVAIAAVEFNLETGETGRRFYERLDLQSCLDKGLFVTGHTVNWWLLQDAESRVEITKEGLPLGEALHKFRLFVQDIGAAEIWAKGSDLPVLKVAYHKLNKEVPWIFRLEQEVRTIFRNNPEVAKNVEFIGVKHNPIDDCLHQIRQCVAIQKTIKVVNE